jgi:hypothetical protein
MVDAPERILRSCFFDGGAEAAENVVDGIRHAEVQALEIDDELADFRVADGQLASHQNFHARVRRVCQQPPKEMAPDQAGRSG